MKSFTVTAGQAVTNVEADSAESAAEIAEPRIREILSAHVLPGDDDYPTELVCHDEQSGADKIFSL